MSAFCLFCLHCFFTASEGGREGGRKYRTAVESSSIGEGGFLSKVFFRERGEVGYTVLGEWDVLLFHTPVRRAGGTGDWTCSLAEGKVGST